MQIINPPTYFGLFPHDPGLVSPPFLRQQVFSEQKMGGQKTPSILLKKTRRMGRQPRQQLQPAVGRFAGGFSHPSRWSHGESPGSMEKWMEKKGWEKPMNIRILFRFVVWVWEIPLNLEFILEKSPMGNWKNHESEFLGMQEIEAGIWCCDLSSGWLAEKEKQFDTYPTYPIFHAMTTYVFASCWMNK